MNAPLRPILKSVALLALSALSPLALAQGAPGFVEWEVATPAAQIPVLSGMALAVLCLAIAFVACIAILRERVAAGVRLFTLAVLLLAGVSLLLSGRALPLIRVAVASVTEVFLQVSPTQLVLGPNLVTNAQPASIRITALVDGTGRVDQSQADAPACAAGVVLAPDESCHVFIEPAATGNRAPTAEAGVDANGFLGASVDLDGSASSDPDNDSLSFAWSFAGVPAGSSAMLLDEDTANPRFTPDVAGSYTVSLVVNDGFLDSAPDLVVITVAEPPTLDADGDGLDDERERALGTDPENPDSDFDGLTDGDEVNTFGTLPLNPDSDNDGATDGLEVAAGTDPLDDTDFPDPSLPPDPAAIAPSPDLSIAASLFDTTRFLYQGLNPIQAGVAPDAVDPLAVAVLRGRVLNRAGAPLPGVSIAVKDNPQFGATRSRADGRFDFVVNGGAVLTITYVADGLLSVQRTIDVPAQDFLTLDDVVLIPLDDRVTTVDLAAPGMKVARGNSVTDADGTRQATMLFPAGTSAQMVLPDGTTSPISSLSVRATEYTVGENGPLAMPGTLPANIGYTYAVELSVDEAEAAGAVSVEFSQPIPVYVENFLQFPVGSAAPSGFYDEQAGRWVASENGIVLQVVGLGGGVAALDVDGDGLEDTGAALDALGITLQERQQLAALYTVGQSLWRVPTPHFTAWDHNWPFGPPEDAEGPDQVPVKEDEPVQERNCFTAGSIIDCPNQVLGEAIGIPGTPYALTYRSDRTPGRRSRNTVQIPLSDGSVPASLKRITLSVRIAGQAFAETFAPLPNQSTTFVWDGRDVYGRPVQGEREAVIRVGYVYDGEYKKPLSEEVAFGRFGSNNISGSRTRQEITISKLFRVPLGTLDARAIGLGGWNLDVHHTYDPNTRVLYQGDGTTRSARNLEPTIRVVHEQIAPREPLKNLTIEYVASAGDGTVFFGGQDNTGASNYYIDRRAPDGTVSRPVETGSIITSIATGPDGSLFFSVFSGDPRFFQGLRVLKPEGTVETVLDQTEETPDCRGSGSRGLAVDANESLYFISNVTRRVCRIDPDGSISIVAGSGGIADDGGDGGPAIESGLLDPRAIALDAQGNLYIRTENRIRMVFTDGVIDTIAGTGASGSSLDGEPARGNPILPRGNIAVAPDGALLVPEIGNKVRRIGTDGLLGTVAGNGAKLPFCDINTDTFDDEIEGIPAQALCYLGAVFVTVRADGTIFLSNRNEEDDVLHTRLLAIAPLLPGVEAGSLVSSESGNEIYVFDEDGRHIRTVSGITGAALQTFGYDAQGRLASVADADQNELTLARDGAGTVELTAPFGQRLTLELDAGGYLARSENELGQARHFEYDTLGLLTRSTSPAGHDSQYTYSGGGRLLQARNPGVLAGDPDDDQVQDFTFARIPGGHSVTRVSAEGATRVFSVVEGADGSVVLRNTFPDGSASTSSRDAMGVRSVVTRSATEVRVDTAPNPRWGMLAPVGRRTAVTTPGGVTDLTENSLDVALLDPANPLLLASLQRDVTVNGGDYAVSFDGATRTLSYTTAENLQGTAVVDARGRVVEITAGDLAPVRFTYDSRGRPQVVAIGSGPDTRRFENSFKADGLVDFSTDPLGRTSVFTHDVLGRLTGVLLPNTETISLAYDVNGNLSGITPPQRAQYRFSYTPIDQIAAEIYPDIGSGETATQYSYNRDGQFTGVTFGDGRSLAIAYDEGSRAVSFSSPRGVLTFGYDPASGQLNKATTPEGLTSEWTFDGILPVTETLSGPVSGDIERVFEQFQLRSLAVNGEEIGFGYDLDERLVAAGDMLYGYDDVNGLMSDAVLLNIEESFEHNAFAELSAYRSELGASTLYSAQYAYNAQGMVTQKEESIGGVTRTTGYTYDDLDRLSTVTIGGVTVATYTYDGNGNRTSDGTTAATYNALDQLTAFGGDTFSYNDAGQLQSRTVSGVGTATYQYDVYGNLLQVRTADGRQIDYLVDGQGRRVRKAVDNVFGAAYLYKNRYNVVAELDAAGDVVSRFVYGTRAHVPDYMIRAGQVFRLITDNVGSVRLVVNATDGTIAQRLDYDPYGAVLVDTNPGFQPFAFAGGLYDADTGLLRFGHRDYDTTTGRWTTRDPLGFNGGSTNLYEYANSNPVNFIDPTGLIPCEELGRGRSFFKQFKKDRKLTSDIIDESIEKLILKSLGLPALPIKGGTNVPFFGLDTFAEIGIEQVFGKTQLRFGKFLEIANAGRFTRIAAEGVVGEIGLQIGIAIGSAINAAGEVHSREQVRKLRKRLNDNARKLGICDC